MTETHTPAVYTIPCPGDSGMCMEPVRVMIADDVIRTAFTCRHGTYERCNQYVTSRALAQHATRADRTGPDKATMEDLTG